ncbi:hypothetical protein [Clostridium tyrobutyricum]|jgi:hypothetical protein|uniref:hypothetical protein n=1 Tax=Clostridium tyrobutyricum TaxID=1519 RepID=UPI000E8DBFCA|nr:hypothetical protein [Clostridium tyrobutyricum]HBF77799.1 hypothetical protein [Clostridiaceae bacterium]
MSISVKEVKLLSNIKIRNQMANRVDIYKSVKQLILLPNSEFATTSQVAQYYEVNPDAISTIVKKHRAELVGDGYEVLKDEELQLCKALTGLNSSSNALAIYPVKVITKIGLFLKHSVVAQTIREQLLNPNNY